jgi:hypothetical protein
MKADAENAGICIYLVTAVIQLLFPELMHVLIMATEETATTSRKNGPIATVTT